MTSIRGLSEVFIIALVVIILSTVVGKAQSLSTDVTTPLSQPSRSLYVLFHQYEAEALDVIRQNWTSQNSQFEKLLLWVDNGRHPCNISNMNYDSSGEFEGDWVGVFCTMILRESNATGYYYELSVTQLMLYGSNSRCGWEYSKQCGFSGIKGVLLPEIAKLISLQRLYMDNHPDLRGPVPIEIWQMPNLLNVALQNNALEGLLASNTFTPASKLQGIYLYKNKFSGRLQISPNGTLFSSTLQFLNVTSNRLSGSVDLRDLNPTAMGNLIHLALDDNEFNGTFSTGSVLHLQNLFLSKNQFTRIQFPNYTGNGSGYMSALQTLYLDNNKLSGPLPQEFLQMPNLRNLNLGNNSFYGLVDFTATTNNLWITRIKSLDLSMNNFSGPVDFRSDYNISELIHLNISNNRFNGTLFTNPSLNIWEIDISNNCFNNITFNGSSDQVENGYMPLLKTLCIQNNILDGEFPYQVLRAPSLEVLYASNNRYRSLQLPHVALFNSSLTEIILVNNNIVSINYPSDPGHFSPSNLEISNLLFLGGNPLCKSIENILLSTICRMNKLSPLLKVVLPSPGVSKSTILKIALSTSVPFALLLLVGGFLLYRSRRKQQYLLLQVQRICEEHDVKPTIFTYNELRAATRDFHPDMKLGQGGYGAVYKGVLPNTNVVAVKQLHIKSQQGMDEFLNEVALISGIKHRNLVKLKGCCIREKQRLLVYEYVDNHDLDWNLLESNSLQVLSWPERLNICLGVAHGLHYLHALAQPKIIHRDIKAANILLDSNLQPKIADFGLALLFPEETSHIMTVHVAGTKGYLAPEYATLGQLSEKADVYSFGVVCLEIVSGRRNIDNKMPPEEVVLTNLIQKLYKEGNIMGIVDSKLQPLSETEHLEVQRVIYTAMLCLQYSEDVRPPMARVVSMLQGDLISVIEDLESAQVPTSFFGGHSTSFDISQMSSLDTIREGDSVRLYSGSSGSTFGSRC
ncbi:hypothetical protein KC19_1G210300 [Ceratodon purpureus]|uniref:Protein kinase domain-containing protein n=1 Tax=Ceratodon purpureus TaxID=3225 RepID=A0A8T0JAC0_CERPU|nr:hypothetical protein KC19_1G210300 [Ceratodon purpureus]